MIIINFSTGFISNLVCFSKKIDPLQSQLNQFIYKEIIFKSRGHDVNNYNKNIIRTLFRCYVENPARLSNFIFKRVQEIESRKNSEWIPAAGAKDDYSLRIIGDHVASMTDRFAILEFEKYAVI